jgi:putative hydrolase of the HAD superfamily
MLIDADGVLQHQPTGWLDRLVERIGVTDREPAEVLDALFAAEQPSLTGDGEFRTALAELLTGWGRADRLDTVLESWHEIDVDEAVLATVGELRARGVRCCLATNQQNVRAGYMRSLYNAHFDDQFYSCEIGVMKPDRAYFATVLERLGTPAEQVVFVDDSPANVAAAREIGIDARLYTGLDVITENR